ncbi:hypothetical protein [Synechococcus phage S-B68]|nr:hypothetical protein [Synechococcus phage S-B68]
MDIKKCYLPTHNLTGQEKAELREFVRFLLSQGRHLEATELRTRHFPIV